jgi:hypothetical protein
MLSEEGHMIARSGKLLKISLQLADRDRRALDKSGNSLNVSGGVAI